MDDTCIKLTVSFLHGTNSVSSTESPCVVGVCPYWGAQRIFPSSQEILWGQHCSTSFLTSIFNFFFFFGCRGWRILVPWPGMESVFLGVEVQSLKYTGPPGKSPIWHFKIKTISVIKDAKISKGKQCSCLLPHPQLLSLSPDTTMASCYPPFKKYSFPMWACEGFPSGSVSKESACNAWELGLISGSGRSPGGGHGNPLQYSCLGNPMDRGVRWAIVPGVTKSQTRLSD